MLCNGIYGETFNFSDENPFKVLDVVKAIYAILDKPLNYKILNNVKHEIKKQYLFSGKARRILKWKPVYSLEKGITMTINWYKEHF